MNNNLHSYPVIKNLLRGQFSILVSAIFILLFILYTINQMDHQRNKKELIINIKKEVLKSNEDLFTWKVMDMTKAIKDEFSRLKSNLPIKNIYFKKKDEKILAGEILVQDNSKIDLVEDVLVFKISEEKTKQEQLFSTSLQISFCFAFIVFLLIQYFSFKYIKRNLYTPLFLLVSTFKKGKNIDAELNSIQAKGEIKDFIKFIQRYYIASKNYENDKAKANLAVQVAHDIRSPLSAMKMIADDLGALPENTRLILRSSMQRIQDIANNLSIKNKKTQTFSNQDTLSVQLLSACIEEMISEKRLHFRAQIGVLIEGNLHDSYGLFAKINLTEFKRLLSNLINNAVEAFDEKTGIVTVHLQEEFQNDRNIQIIIEDNGKGIPQEIIAQLGEKGASFGKENHKDSGSGLGLYHAKKTMESWQGHIKIESKLEVGTKMILTLPKGPVPDWFVSNLAIKKEMAIVILDDDQGIHQIWDKKFKESKIFGHQIFHLCCPEDFSKWITEQSQSFEKVLYLCDFELIGFTKTGLDLIEEFSLGKDAILVTSHYEEDEIQRRCKESGIKLIPKMIVAHVPITAENLSIEDGRRLLAPTQKHKEETKIILLDDDILTRMVWKEKAKEKGINLEIFEFPDELYNKLENLSKNTTYYIDSSLTNGQKGEDVALNLFNKGHKNLFLATGHEPEAFEKLGYLKGVIGKSPPW